MERLLLIQNGVVMHSYPLDSGSLTIGRHKDNAVRLNSPAVSTRHAVVSLVADPYLEGHNEAVLEDLDSTNGTLVNGQPVRRYTLQAGDHIRIGPYEFAFERDEAQGERTAIYLPDNDG